MTTTAGRARLARAMTATVLLAGVVTAVRLGADAGGPAPAPPVAPPVEQGGPPRATDACAGLPSRVQDLRGWKLTLPTVSDGVTTEIGGPELTDYAGAPWFVATPDCRGIVFRAPVNGATTSTSGYPRSELREMDPDGSDASWSSSSGTHTMAVVEAFTALPRGRPNLVGAQIHGSSDDVTVFRLEGRSLWVTKGDDAHYRLATASYQLGTPFEARYVVAGGTVRAFFNGRLVATIAKNFSKAYFKVGAYTQANCRNSIPCSPDNYGETVLYSVRVTHS